MAIIDRILTVEMEVEYYNKQHDNNILTFLVFLTCVMYRIWKIINQHFRNGKMKLNYTV